MRSNFVAGITTQSSARATEFQKTPQHCLLGFALGLIRAWIYPTIGNSPTSKSRPVETTEGAMDEYLAQQKAERAKMAKLRALRQRVGDAEPGRKAKR